MDGLRNCPNQIAIFAHGGLEVNDFDRGRFMTKKLGVRLGGVKPSQRVLKMKIDGAPRKREATLESAVWQATLRLALRAGFLEKREKCRTRRYASPLKWPTRREDYGGNRGQSPNCPVNLPSVTSRVSRKFFSC